MCEEAPISVKLKWVVFRICRDVSGICPLPDSLERLSPSLLEKGALREEFERDLDVTLESLIPCDSQRRSVRKAIFEELLRMLRIYEDGVQVESNFLVPIDQLTEEYPDEFEVPPDSDVEMPDTALIWAGGGLPTVHAGEGDEELVGVVLQEDDLENPYDLADASQQAEVDCWLMGICSGHERLRRISRNEF